MNKSTLLFLIILSFYDLKAQKHVAPNSNYPIDLKQADVQYLKFYLGEDISIESIENYLINQITNLRSDNSTLRFVHKKESQTGKHFLFQQFINNRKVYNATVKININNEGFVTSVFNNTFSPGMIKDRELNSQSRKEESLSELEPCYFFDGTALVQANIEINADNKLIVIDNSQTEIYNKDLNLYFKDTTARGTVFLLDPLTKANVFYGTPYADNDDDDIIELNLEIDTVILNLKYDQLIDSFILENNYVKITEHSFPEINPVTSDTATFYYSREQSGFEDVNAFYHITEYNKYVKSLGFSNLLNYQIHIDTHGLNGQDNSTFISSGTSPRISFGEGGVDDAEDADVVIHEYTHAIMFDATGENPSGTERSTLDEANADILASSYSRSISEFRWDEVYTWDGHNEFWDGRMTSGNKHYPEDLQNNKYYDTDIWSAAIMEIGEKLGRETTDKLLIESAFNYSTGMTMRDAAKLFMEADTALNKGVNTWDICNTMLSRGLLSECLVGISDEITFDNKIVLWNTENFSKGTESAFLYSIDSINITLNFYDLRGRLIKSDSYKNVERVVISPINFSAGTYVLKATYGDKEKSFKLIKF